MKYDSKGIRALRLRLDLTQKQMGVLLGFAEGGAASQMSDIERGKRVITRQTSLIAEHLHYLMDYDLATPFLEEVGA